MEDKPDLLTIQAGEDAVCIPCGQVKIVTSNAVGQFGLVVTLDPKDFRALRKIMVEHMEWTNKQDHAKVQNGLR